MFLEQIPFGHIRLFGREIVDMMDEEDFSNFLQFTNSVQRQRLKSELSEDIKTKLFKCLAFSSNSAAMNALRRHLINKADEKVHDRLLLKGLRSHEFYAKFFEGDGLMMDRIVSVIEPEVIVKFLQGINCREYDDLLKSVNEYLKNKRIPDAACRLMRDLPYCSDYVGSSRQLGEWYYNFLEACTTSGYTSMIPGLIDSNFKESLARFQIAKELEKKRFVNQLSIKSELLIDNTDCMYLAEPRSQANYLRNQGVSHDFQFNRNEYTLRPYQNELVSEACKGKNTIICAPTGCGKTIIATNIFLNHIQEFRRQKRVARAIMLVPTIPLVEQQTMHFIRYCYGVCWVDGVSGIDTSANRSGRAGIVLATDLCVMTPQILINMLNSILKADKLYFSDFTLLIFDECHHASGLGHPYRVLLDMLRQCEMLTKPQIVGLTASIGVGGTSWDALACRKHMLRLCSFMMADTISTVKKHYENLRFYIEPPPDVIERIERPKNDTFSTKIKETMVNIQQVIITGINHIIEQKILPLKETACYFPDPVGLSRYQNFVATLKDHFLKLKDSELRLKLMLSIDHLSIYFHTLAVSDLLPNMYGFKYLDGKMKSYAVNSDASCTIVNELLSQYNEIRGNLCNMAIEEETSKKGILKKLYEIIIHQYFIKPESRTLIFVPTRICAHNLSEHLSEYLARRKDLNCFYNKTNIVGYMISSNQSASFGGQSAEMQLEMRRKFECGDVKILVVTSVADEGINIMECNLVIKYNSVGSERTLIQRRGRARAKDARSILLALDKSIEAQEYENIKKEFLMRKCVVDLQSYTNEMLKNQIAEQGELIKFEYEQRERALREQRKRLESKKFRLHCRMCNAEICESMDVRVVGETDRVCCNPLVWTRTTYKLIKNPTKSGLLNVCALWTCKCGSELGTIVRYAGAFLPRINAHMITLEELNSNEIFEAKPSNMKWSFIEKNFFYVDAITATNIREMNQSLANFASERLTIFKDQEELLERILNEKAKSFYQKKRKYLLE